MADPRASLDSVSHGRGGAGNIGADPTPYVDGEITREGVVGDHGDGAYGTGRGGAGNVGSPGLAPTNRKDSEVVPEVALRPSSDEPVHTGRGGAGNVADAQPAVEAHPEGLADKLKHKLFKSKSSKTQS